MKEEELSKRIEDTKSEIYNSNYRGKEYTEKLNERIERLEQLYEDLYGY